MKVDEIKNGLKQLSVDDLKSKVDELRRELFSLTMNASTAHIRDYSQFKKLRKNIARALTYMQRAQNNQISA